MSDQNKILLEEREMPTQWYNILADLPAPMPPPLHPGTHEPATAEDFGPLFPMALIEQEMTGDRYVDIPGEVLDVYKLWRPTPLFRARRLERQLDTPAKIFYKYEGVSPAGSHKPNTAVPQAYYNAKEGVSKLTTETGAGQWGSALAFACSQFGLECEVWMVAASYHSKPSRRTMMEVWGGKVHPSPSSVTEYGRSLLKDDPDHPGSLGIAISEAVSEAVADERTRYALGSVLNHVLMHQTIIGEETLLQLAKVGETPDILIGCTGTRSIPFPENTEDIESVNKRLDHQIDNIKEIEQKLIQLQTIINNESREKDKTSQLNHELKNTINTDSKEQDYLNILNKLQNKIEILEDRTFYTDSLFFAIVNDMVLVENKISSLILSFKEMNNLSIDKTANLIPQITDEDYTTKYIESLSHYQNAEWNLSLNGFNYLIQVDSNHDLADNCQYWIGEVYYALTDYNRSIKEFGKVFSFPGTNKSDDAQFKMGLCYMNIGQIEKAKKEFTNLLEFYPNSEYYTRAQDYLKQN